MRMLVILLAMLLLMPAATAAEQRQGPPPLPEAAAEYYVGVNGQPVGPLTLQQLRERVGQGQTKREDLVWKAGLQEWAAAQTFAELQEVFQALPPAMPRETTFNQMMIGTWETTWQYEGWVMSMRISYTADGNYLGGMIANPPGQQPIEMPMSGTWSTLPLEGKNFTLAAKSAQGESNTTPFRVVDQNTLEDLGLSRTWRKVAM